MPEYKPVTELGDISECLWRAELPQAIDHGRIVMNIGRLEAIKSTVGAKLLAVADFGGDGTPPPGANVNSMRGTAQFAFLARSLAVPDLVGVYDHQAMLAIGLNRTLHSRRVADAVYGRSRTSYDYQAVWVGQMDRLVRQAFLWFGVNRFTKNSGVLLSGRLAASAAIVHDVCGGNPKLYPYLYGLGFVADIVRARKAGLRVFRDRLWSVFPSQAGQYDRLAALACVTVIPGLIKVRP